MTQMEKHRQRKSCDQQGVGHTEKLKPSKRDNVDDALNVIWSLADHEMLQLQVSLARPTGQLPL